MAAGLVIIPAYNEESNIGKVLDEIINMNLDVDILVIDDGSADRTKYIAKQKNVEVLSHPYNMGYGAALQTGFKYAVESNYKYVIQFDADGQHYPEYIKEMIEELERDSYDIIIGSRFIENKEYKTSNLKMIVIKLMRMLIKLFTGKRITDPTSGFQGLSSRTFKYYSVMGNFPYDYPDADIIIQMLRLGYRLKEIPITIKERTCGESMHSGIKPLIYLLKMLLSIFIVIIRDVFLKEKNKLWEPL